MRAFQPAYDRMHEWPFHTRPLDRCPPHFVLPNCESAPGQGAVAGVSWPPPGNGFPVCSFRPAWGVRAGLRAKLGAVAGLTWPAQSRGVGPGGEFTPDVVEVGLGLEW